jgi:uncharacterized protein YecE (DUF72 family)
MAIQVGIGSWADTEYTGVLYPPGLPASQRLKTYATHFKFVEVNSTYYATPRRPVVESWIKQTPPDFLFHIKLHRAFSQSPRKTIETGKLLDWTLRGVQPLVRTQKLGAFLLVLSPDFGPDRHGLEELDPLVKALQPHALAVELRDAAWVKGTRRADTLEYFRERRLVWVAVDMPRIKGASIMPPIDEVTSAELAYLRLHGRNQNWLKAKSAAERHAFTYTTAEMRQIARRVQRLAESAVNVHVVANNHAHDYAPKTALALRELLARI